MPIFEFTCNDCKAPRFSELVGVVADSAPPTCPKCGSANVKKLVSRFARIRSEDDALEQLADMADGLDENDPKALRRMMKEMAHGMDEDISSEEIESMMDEAIETDAMAAGGESDDEL